MKLALIIVTLFLLSTSIVSAGVSSNIKVNSEGSGSSVKVNVKNSVNTGGKSETSSDTQTKVDIHQEGGGTSTVVINGKEYKVEGTGDLSVNEGSDPNSEDTVLGTEDEKSTDESEIENKDSEEEKEDGTKKSIPQRMKESFVRVKVSIKNFFTRIFSAF